MLKNSFPYVDEDLLSVERFVSYCKDRGLNITIKFLEYLHKESLVYPILRINPWINKFKKIKIDWSEKYVHIEDLDNFKYQKVSNKTYYSLSGFFYWQEGFLNFYKENRMLEYPIKDKKFIVWENYKVWSRDFLESMWSIKNYRILLYSKKQIYLINEIVGKRYKVENFIELSLLWENEIHLKSLYNLFLRFDNNFKNKTYIDICNFFSIYYKVNKLYNEYYKLLISYINKKIIANESKNNEIQKILSWWKFERDFNKDFFPKNKIYIRPSDKKLIEDFITQFILKYWTFIEMFDSIKHNKSLLKLKNNLFVSEFILEVLYPMEFYLKLNNKDYIRMTTNLLGNVEFKSCNICWKIFKPRRINDINCSEECSKKYKNQQIKKWRAEWKYIY